MIHRSFLIVLLVASPAFAADCPDPPGLPTVAATSTLEDALRRAAVFGRKVTGYIGTPGATVNIGQ